jgi:hypothetical protein
MKHVVVSRCSGARDLVHDLEPMEFASLAWVSVRVLFFCTSLAVEHKRGVSFEELI